VGGDETSSTGVVEVDPLGDDGEPEGEEVEREVGNAETGGGGGLLVCGVEESQALGDAEWVGGGFGGGGDRVREREGDGGVGVEGEREGVVAVAVAGLLVEAERPAEESGLGVGSAAECGQEARGGEIPEACGVCGG
jgi:hypothetical protein